MIRSNFESVPRLSKNIDISKIEKDNYVIYQTALDRRIKVNSSVMAVIDILKRDDVITWTDLSVNLNAKNDFNFTLSDLKKLLFEDLAPLGIVDAESIALKKKPDSYLSLKVPLLSAKKVGVFSGIFVKLFHPTFFYFASTVALIFLLALYFYNFDFIQVLKDSSGQDILIISSLMLCSVFLHELGHATACRKFGAKHGGIGFGFYIFSPVFYADVSDVWKLKPSQRIIVDLAGLYLELLLATLFGIIYLFTGSHIAILFITYTLIALLVNLNPFFRYDGYWVLSDVVQISNLKSKSIKLFKQFFSFSPNRKTLKTKLDYFLFAYGFFSITFFLFFLFYVVISNPYSILYFPIRLFEFIKHIITANELVNFEWLKNEVKSLAMPFFFYLIVLRMIFKRSFKIRTLFKL